MTRTQVLQEIRRMRFEEAYGGWQERRLTQEEAARLLGVCERTFRRYVDRYEDEGLDGLVDKRLSQVSARRARSMRWCVFHGLLLALTVQLVAGRGFDIADVAIGSVA